MANFRTVESLRSTSPKTVLTLPPTRIRLTLNADLQLTNYGAGLQQTFLGRQKIELLHISKIGGG
jgi:hypothetical protein